MNTETPDLEALRAKAEAGDAEAQFAMGEALYPDDYLAALRWYRAAASQGHTESQYRAGSLLSMFEGSAEAAREAVKWLKKAADKGHLQAMRELAQIYLYGWEGRHGGYDGKSYSYKNLPRAFRLYEKLCALGDSRFYHQCGLMLLEGLGVPKNTEEGLGYMLTAACSEPLKTRTFAILTDCYARGIGSVQNPVEAYIWALMAKANDYFGDYITEHDARIAALEAELGSPLAIRKAQKEARRREKLRQEGKLTPEYCLAQAAKYKPGLAPGDRVQIIGRAVIPEEPAAKAKDTPAEDDDPEPSSVLEYSYLKTCRKHFDPSLVQFELVIPRKLNKRETLDFTQLKIRYNGRDTDIKNESLLCQKDIHRGHRKLLVRLAAQYSIADPDQRHRNICRILQEPRTKSLVSRWNSLFEAVFPRCSKQRYSKMINRETGHIAIGLKVDTTKITNASDYDTCYLKG